MSVPPTASGGSLADRITTNPNPTPAHPAASLSTSWADEVSSPLEEPKSMPIGLDGATQARGGGVLEDQRDELDVQVTYNSRLAKYQSDLNNPLYSNNASFDAMIPNKDITQGLISMNFHKPSKIQEKALPLLLADPPSNMIAQSQSGTGKTAAFVIAILSRIDYTLPNEPQALVLAPSRELARQIEGVVRTIGQYVPNLKIQAAVPGAVTRGSNVQASVIIGTPGTVLDLIKRRQLNAQKIKVFVMDEADNMLDQQGLGDQSNMVKRVLRDDVQVLLFSATFPDRVVAFANTFAPDANKILLERDQLTVSGIKQMFIDCNGDDGKYDYICKLYGMLTIGSSIIFVRQRETANRLQASLTSAGHKVSSVHGAFDGAERDRVVQEFRDGTSKVLITTNVLARGLDVSTVSMVINYDIPMTGKSDEEPDYETYLHRIGRTGRFGRVGVSISFVFDRRSFQALQKIVQHFAIDLVQLSPDDWDANESTIKQVIKESGGEPA